MNPVKKWWNGQSERRRDGLRFVGIAIVLLITVMVSISVVSYVLTWQPDQSALASGENVQNAAASGGLSLGHFLVTESFGLASFCLVVFLLEWAIKLIWSASGIRIRRWFFGLLTLTFLLSWILAFVDIFLPWDYLFGGGMGGRAGAALVSWAVAKTGLIVTGLALLFLLILWVFFMSRRFYDWIMGHKRELPEVDEASEMPVETTDTLDEMAGQAGHDEEEPVVIEPEPEPEPMFVTSPTHEIPGQAGNDGEEDNPDEGINVVKDDTLEQEVKEPLKPIDNRLDPPDGLPKYKTPELSILGDYAKARHEVQQEELVRNNTKIRNTLANYKIQVRDVTAIVGPTVTLYKVYPAPGVKIAAIKQLQEDIGISLGARGVRITTLSDSVGIEVANDVASIVPLKSLLNDAAFATARPNSR
jgi:S-DNA-T family DNA segregation ATPase FtsK/SpoIIIE